MLSILFLKPDLTFFSQQSLDVFGNASLKTLSLMAFLTHYTAWIVSGQTINSMLALCDNTSSRLFSQYTSQHKSFYFFNVLYSPQNCVGFLFLDLHPPCPPRRRLLRLLLIFVTHHLSHTHTHLCHTPSFTHIFVTHRLSCRRGTWRHWPSFCVAGEALGDTRLRFTWQVWHLATSTVFLRGRRGTYGAGLGLVARLGPLGRPWRRGTFAWQAWYLATSTCVLRGRHGTWRHPPSFCVAGVGRIWEFDLWGSPVF